MAETFRHLLSVYPIRCQLLKYLDSGHDLYAIWSIDNDTVKCTDIVRKWKRISTSSSSSSSSSGRSLDETITMSTMSPSSTTSSTGGSSSSSSSSMSLESTMKIKEFVRRLRTMEMYVYRLLSDNQREARQLKLSATSACLSIDRPSIITDEVFMTKFRALCSIVDNFDATTSANNNSTIMQSSGRNAAAAAAVTTNRTDVDTTKAREQTRPYTSHDIDLCFCALNVQTNVTACKSNLPDAYYASIVSIIDFAFQNISRELLAVLSKNGELLLLTNYEAIEHANAVLRTVHDRCSLDRLRIDLTVVMFDDNGTRNLFEIHCALKRYRKCLELFLGRTVWHTALIDESIRANDDLPTTVDYSDQQDNELSHFYWVHPQDENLYFHLKCFYCEGNLSTYGYQTSSPYFLNTAPFTVHEGSLPLHILNVRRMTADSVYVSLLAARKNERQRQSSISNGDGYRSNDSTITLSVKNNTIGGHGRHNSSLSPFATYYRLSYASRPLALEQTIKSPAFAITREEAMQQYLRDNVISRFAVYEAHKRQKRQSRHFEHGDDSIRPRVRLHVPDGVNEWRTVVWAKCVVADPNNFHTELLRMHKFIRETLLAMLTLLATTDDGDKRRHDYAYDEFLCYTFIRELSCCVVDDTTTGSWWFNDEDTYDEEHSESCCYNTDDISTIVDTLIHWIQTGRVAL